jgi:6-phosphogluconolactonase
MLADRIGFANDERDEQGSTESYRRRQSRLWCGLERPRRNSRFMTDIAWADKADDDAVADRVAAAMAEGGLLVVPGGKTPKPILAALAGRALPWARIAITLTDDRDVPPDHEASNFGALASALARTGAELRPLREGTAPGRARLLWFGMGEDGHVASLFPNVRLDPADPPAIVHTLPDPLPADAPFARLTLNYAALADADEVILVARGASKRRRIEQAAAGRSGLPIAVLMAALGAPLTVYWQP